MAMKEVSGGTTTDPLPHEMWLNVMRHVESQNKVDETRRMWTERRNRDGHHSQQGGGSRNPDDRESCERSLEYVSGCAGDTRGKRQRGELRGFGAEMDNSQWRPEPSREDRLHQRDDRKRTSKEQSFPRHRSADHIRHLRYFESPGRHNGEGRMNESHDGFRESDSEGPVSIDTRKYGHSGDERQRGRTTNKTYGIKYEKNMFNANRKTVASTNRLMSPAKGSADVRGDRTVKDWEEANLWEEQRAQNAREKAKLRQKQFTDSGDPAWRQDMFYKKVLRAQCPFLNIREILDTAGPPGKVKRREPSERHSRKSRKRRRRASSRSSYSSESRSSFSSSSVTTDRSRSPCRKCGKCGRERNSRRRRKH